MGNFKLDYYLSKRLRILSDKTNKSEIEILEEMFADYESNIAWQEIKYTHIENIKTNKVKPNFKQKIIKY